jgi:branched-chain amino acid transport system permease protein
MSTQPSAASLRRAAPSRKQLLVFVGLVLLLTGAALPWLTADTPFVLVLACNALIAALLAVSLDMLMGNTGLLSFGHGAWFGLGAYVTGILAKHLSEQMLITVPLAMLTAFLLASAVGFIFVRQLGKAFAILTLAFGQVLYALVFIASRYTGGEDGLQGVPQPLLAGLRVSSYSAWYWLLYASLVVALAVLFWARRSPLGKAWLGLTDNAERAAFIGIDVFRLKFMAYVGSATVAAYAGGVFALFNGAATPDTLHWFESGKILMYVVLGGVGSIFGPALGAVFFTVAEHYVSSFTDSWLIYFGAIFVVVVIVAPGGLAGLLRSAQSRLARRSDRGLK